ncbi:MAG: ISKra4 family transposase, partial [Actinomycetales bacterium]|nr:ISKra4 family transposase [Actinomycetales bacterium]
MSNEPATMTPDGFAEARERFETILDWLDGAASSVLDHGELERELDSQGRELLRRLLQDHLELRAIREIRVEVLGADGARRSRVEAGHGRGLATIFGQVTVTRLAYRELGQTNLHPADAVLNLPAEKHSHGLRHLAAIESSRGSFDGAVEAIERSTGQHLGKRQVEDLAARAAVDFEAFYLQRQSPTGEVGDVLVLSCDGKG